MEMPSQQQFATTSGRRADRAPFDASVTFRAGTRKAAVRVRDISTLGARIGGVFLVHVDDRFFLTLPGLESIEARVAWVTDFEFGCEFAKPINPVILESLMRRIR
ncbi:PilZ domain-containing protein [Novosphingobium sp. B 225]|uniref:PilZ domain-containing protein n=1 Tax=Novosphingobium sp. B 225 TaxID=1961849 RepID=UPI000B4A9B53|nr:PilZ domain-containing protein [Novosphingobium sp. B 225]